MRSILVLVPEVGPAPGPDLTRYLLVCGGAILGLLVLAWIFRRTLSGQLKARAARRSLQVLDVLPLAGKQKLVVVRCYDRSFLLGLGDKEVRSIAELDLALDPIPSVPPSRSKRSVLDAFGTILRGQLGFGAPTTAGAPRAGLPSEPEGPVPKAHPERRTESEGVVA